MSELARAGNEMVQIVGYMQGMADTIRSMDGRIAHLEEMLQKQELRVPVSRAQERAIQAAIRQRAESWANSELMAAWAKTQIRRAVRSFLRENCGVEIRGMGEVPACQYETIMALIAMWDE